MKYPIDPFTPAAGLAAANHGHIPPSQGFPHTMIGSSSGAGGLIAALVLADRVCRSGTCTLPSNTDRLSPGIGILPDVRRRVLGGRR